MKNLNISSLDDLIRKTVNEAFRETIAPLVTENVEEERQKEQAKKETEFKKINKAEPKDKAKDENKAKENSEPEVEEPGPKGKKVHEADKDSLNPKSMMDQLEKLDDENKPNISKEKMQVVFPSKEQVIRADVKHVLMMLNMMRSGKSLKKTETRRQLQDYYGTLNSGEKQALFATISGLTQILAAGVPGKSAVDPSYISLGISPTASNEKSDNAGEKEKSTAEEKSTASDGIFKVAAPNKTVKKPAQSSVKKPEGSDDTPIVVGEVANKAAIKKIYESLRKG
jgi:hypothetical protein